MQGSSFLMPNSRTSFGAHIFKKLTITLRWFNIDRNGTFEIHDKNPDVPWLCYITKAYPNNLSLHPSPIIDPQEDGAKKTLKPNRWIPQLVLSFCVPNIV